jgi:hypothetical protein
MVNVFLSQKSLEFEAFCAFPVASHQSRTKITYLVESSNDSSSSLRRARIQRVLCATLLAPLFQFFEKQRHSQNSNNHHHWLFTYIIVGVACAFCDYNTLSTSVYISLLYHHPHLGVSWAVVHFIYSIESIRIKSISISISISPYHHAEE